MKVKMPQKGVYQIERSAQVSLFTFSSAVNHLKSPFIASTIHCTCSACLIYFIERPPTVSGSSTNPSGRMFRSVLLLLPLLVAVAAVPAERTQVYLVSPPCLSLRLSIRYWITIRTIEETSLSLSIKIK